jgi:C-terminal processing protease CtpA/Prc
MGSSGSKASSPNNGPSFANNNLYDFLQGTSKGLHIHSLTPSSPASLSGLESFFDFITHLNGERVESANDWTMMLEEVYRKMDGAPSPLYLIVYSSKTTTLRNITVIPTLQISGNAGESSVAIGAGVKECDFSNAHERVWHVLEVIPGSPAALSGLVEQTDYIVGSRDVEGGKGLVAKSDFGTLVSLFEKRFFIL